MICYYARPINIFNTDQDKRDILSLEKIGMKVVDILDKEIQDRYKVDGMNLFKDLVQKSDLLFFRATPFGDIPAGVAKEILWAKEIGIPVFEMPSCIERRTLSVDETREYLMNVGQR